MGQHVLLNNVDHHDLRLITRHGASLGDGINQVLVFPSEFHEVQRHYPIVFRRTDAGGFKSVALLGFEKDENLFLQGDRWTAAYVPGIQKVGPFLIGHPKATPGQDLPPDAEAMILIDADHPRISKDHGEPLFLAHGGNSAALNHVTGVLRQLYAGAQVSDAMFAAFYEAGLLAPVAIDVKLDENQAYKLEDMFTISRDVLHGLSGDQLRSLNAQGFLALAFHVVSSMSNLGHMISLKTRRDVAQATA